MSGQRIDHSTDCTLPWCDTTCAQPDEHLGTPVYTPATMSLIGTDFDSTGAIFPIVGVGLCWDRTRDPNRPPSIVVHLSGRNLDAEVELRYDEALALSSALDTMICALEHGEVW